MIEYYKTMEGLGVNIEDNDLSGIIKFKPEITYNNTRNYKSGKKAPDGIELRFGTYRPTSEQREILKAHGFQFSEKQTIWYALDNEKSRELIDTIIENEIDVDDAQYEKRHFWTFIRSLNFYNKLTNYTEFMVGTPPQFYRTKKQLESKNDVKGLIYNDLLKFKKFYNKVIGEEGEEEQSEETDQEDEEENDQEENDEEEQEEQEEIPSRSKPDLKLAQKLMEMAQGMQKLIDAKLNSATARQRPTAKRLRVASGQRQDGYRLLGIQNMLYALSKAHQTGSLTNFSFLKNIRNKAQVELINKFTDIHGRKEDDSYLQSVFNHQTQSFRLLGIKNVSDWSIANVQRFDLLQNFSDRAFQQQTEQQRQIEELEIKIKSKKIEGFFPTPKKLIDELINLAHLQKGDQILEPSAGKGDILDRIKEQFKDSVTLSACEIHYDLRELLKLKGYDLAGTDFLQLHQTFDKIIMNPPFEKGLDIDHVLHALSLLNKGGRLVAIMGEGAFFRSFKKDKDFRDKLFHVNAFISDKIQGAFKDAFNQTGIAVRIVVINQDGTFPQIESRDEIDDLEETEEQAIENEDEESDTEQLELEALAEMEMLKMELELKQKKQGLNGSNSTIQNILYPVVWDIH